MNEKVGHTTNPKGLISIQKPKFERQSVPKK